MYHGVTHTRTHTFVPQHKHSRGVPKKPDEPAESMMRRTASAAPALRLAAVRACSSSSTAAAAAATPAAAAPASSVGRSVLATLYQGGVKESELYPYPSFAATADTPVVAADSDTAKVVRKAAEAGAFGSTLAEAPQRTWVFEQLGEKAGLSQVTSAFYHASVCAALQQSGTEAQKAGPLKKLEAGEAVAAYCLTEERYAFFGLVFV